MTRCLPTVLCTLVLAGCGNADQPVPSAANPAPAASPAIKPVLSAAPDPAALPRYDGYGDMRFGMDEAAFGKAWDGELKATPPAPGATCVYKRPAWVKAPKDFAFLFEGSHFVRYDIGTAKEAAPGGGKVGMDAAQIRALYAHVDEQPHKYVAGAKYLRVRSPQGNSVLVFETDEHGNVTRWHLGVPPQVDYVEGCG